MVRVVKEVREQVVETDTPAPGENERSVGSDHGTVVFARVVYFFGGLVVSVIAIRILLSLLGANQANAFADFIYSVSYPFVAPFFGLFSYSMQYGVSRFEFESVIALIVWALVAGLIARLAVIGNKTTRID